ncbi:MAG: hypothetical protein ACLTEH_00110 [Clostridia bacterium]
MFEEKDSNTFKENIEMMNLNHMFQTKQYDKAKTIGFNTDDLYVNLEQKCQEKGLF